MNFLTRPITSERLEEKGQSMYKTGKLLMFYGLCGFGLLVFSLLVTLALGGGNWVLRLLAFNIQSPYQFMYLVMPLCYIAILLGLIGIPMYFNGLHVFALGRIAHNTEKN